MSFNAAGTVNQNGMWIYVLLSWLVTKDSYGFYDFFIAVGTSLPNIQGQIQSKISDQGLIFHDGEGRAVNPKNYTT